MLSYIDTLLNKITMYRLVLYGLTVIAVYALILNAIGKGSFGLYQSFSLLALLSVVCFATNWLFGRMYKMPVNIESQFITAFILFFILMPPSSAVEYVVAALAGFVAMASKFVLTSRGRHIFNPAAVGLVVIMLLGRGEGIWWIGTLSMLPLTLLLGFLIVRKLKTYALVFSFFGASLVVSTVVGILYDLSAFDVLLSAIVSGPIIFFGTVMVTEPLTTPPTKRLQIIYGLIIGVVSGIPFSFGPVHGSPELALVVGNALAFIVAPKQRVALALRESREIAQNTYEFIFDAPTELEFTAGQYVECTLPHRRADMRGIRRYFTVASAPKKGEVRFGVRVDKLHGSSFKKAMMALTPGSRMVAGDVSGDFTLPRDPKAKVAFIAGGIGVTPFRSMVEELKDANAKRDAVLFYANKTEAEIAYKDVFDAARPRGVRTVYLLNEAGPSWPGERGFLTRDIIEKHVPDHKERTFYISGPHGMVVAFEKMLKEMGMPSRQVKVDFFPGY